MDKAGVAMDGLTGLKANGRWLALAAAAGLGLALSGWLSGLAVHQESGLETLWAGNAFLLGILITRGKSTRDIVAIAAGGLAGGLILHIGRHDPVALTLLFSLANITESLVALFVLKALNATEGTFDRVSDVLAFGIACAIGSFASAMLGALGLAIDWQVGFAVAWLNWFVAALLSQLVLAPMIVMCSRLTEHRQLRGLAGRRHVEVVAILGLVAGVASLVFFTSTLPLLFLVSPTVLIATFRLRAFGAVAAVAIVAVIVVYANATGHGPIVHNIARTADQIMLLQLFLAMTFLSSLPVAAMLAERDLQGEEARLLAQHFQAVVENVGEVIFRTDAAGRWSYLNPAWEELSGYPIAHSLGQSWLRFVDDADRAELADRARPVFAGEAATARRVLRFHTASGVRWVELFLQPLRDPDGGVVGVTGTLRDIDDRKRLEEHVVKAKRRAEAHAREATLLAATDELTGIANRRAFLRHLDREIEGATEFGLPLAVAMFDVDHFKAVNDRHGHAVGDRVLRQIAARANAVVRSGDVVGRLGGEEFGIVMSGATAEDATVIAERLREAMEMSRGADDPFLPGVTISVGIAVREGQRDAAALLNAADEALYVAKGDGRNRVRIAA